MYRLCEREKKKRYKLNAEAETGVVDVDVVRRAGHNGGGAAASAVHIKRSSRIIGTPRLYIPSIYLSFYIYI